MANEKKARMTVAERREMLNKQLADLDFAEIIEEKVGKIIEDLEQEISSYKVTSERDGYEDEQATTYTGELLWVSSNENDYGQYTNEQGIKKFGKEVWEVDRLPFYRTKWKSVAVPEDELSDWAKRQINAYTKIIDYLKAMEY
jgi:hypothetical protein